MQDNYEGLIALLRDEEFISQRDGLLALLITCDAAATALETLTRENAELRAAKWDVKHTSTTETLVQQGLAIETLTAERDAALAEAERLKRQDGSGVCTCCDDTGVTIQTERICACSAGQAEYLGRKLTATQARLEEAVEVLKYARDDLLMRAELSWDEKVVAVGAGVWSRMTTFLAKETGNG